MNDDRHDLYTIPRTGYGAPKVIPTEPTAPKIYEFKLKLTSDCGETYTSNVKTLEIFNICPNSCTNEIFYPQTINNKYQFVIDGTQPTLLIDNITNKTPDCCKI